MKNENQNPFNGRHRYDGRYFCRDIAIQIVDLLRVVRTMTGLPNRDIAKLIGSTSSTVSMAVGGRAGEKKMETLKENLEDIILK